MNDITIYDFASLILDDQEVSIYDMPSEKIVWKGLSQKLTDCPYADDLVCSVDVVNEHLNINIEH